MIIWRIFDRPPPGGLPPEIAAERLLEIRTAASRLVWHPFNPNAFLLLGADGGAHVVDTTRLLTAKCPKGGHAVCVPDGPGTAPASPASPLGVALGPPAATSTDGDFSADGTRVLVAGADGRVTLWNVLGSGGRSPSPPAPASTPPAKSVMEFTPHSGAPVDRCLFLPGRDSFAPPGKEKSPVSFITSCGNNTTVTLWDLVEKGDGYAPVQVQTVSLPGGDANLACDRTGRFLLLSERSGGILHVLHIDRAQPRPLRFDYVAPFTLTYPVLSWHVMDEAGDTGAPQDDAGDADADAAAVEERLDVYCVQSRAVQILRLRASSCYSRDYLPAGGAEQWEDDPAPAKTEPPPATTDEEEGDFYDADDDDGFEAATTPSPTAVAPPPAPVLPLGEANAAPDAFANWLGSIVGLEGVEAPHEASQPIPTQSMPALPAVQTELPTAAPEDGGGSDDDFLSPMDFLGVAKGPAGKPGPGEGTKAAGEGSAGEPPPALPSPDDWKIGLPASPPDVAPPSPKRPPKSGRSPKRGDRSPKRAGHSPKPGGHSPKRASGKKQPSKQNGKPVQHPSSSDVNQALRSPLAILKRDDGAAAAPVPILVKSSAAVAAPAILAKTPHPRASLEPVTSSPVSVAPAPPTLSAKDVENAVRRALEGYASSRDAAIAREVQKAVAHEVRAAVVPAVTACVTDAAEVSIARVVQAAVGKGVKEGLRTSAKGVVEATSERAQETMVAAFKETMTKTLIPSYEQATQQMLQQIGGVLEGGIQKSHQDQNESIQLLKTEIDGMASSLANLTGALESLSVKVNHVCNSLAQSVEETRVRQVALPPPVDPLAAAMDEIRALLASGSDERAFSRALQGGDVSLCLFVCQHADLSRLFHGDQPVLSQGVLLCLLQRLGSAAGTGQGDLQLTLTWLQEIAVTLDPNDPSIQNHSRKVLLQLMKNVNAAISLQTDHTKKRSLQMLLQVIRGIGGL